MLFELCNALATFQGWIKQTLEELIDTCCILYLDYMLIYSDTLEQCYKDIKTKIGALRVKVMKVKFSKCEFRKTKTEYFGFIISQKGFQVDSGKINAIFD